MGLDDKTKLYGQVQRELREKQAAVKPRQLAVLHYRDALNDTLTNQQNNSPLSVRIICMLVLEEQLALRPQDFIKTRIGFNGKGDDPYKELHYLDLQNGEWTFRSVSTKNKLNRSFKLLPETLNKLLRMLGPVKSGQPLVFGRHGQAFKATPSLSITFKKYVGLTFMEVRKSVISELNNNPSTKIEKSKELAYRLGHSLMTALLEYTSTPKSKEAAEDEEVELDLDLDDVWLWCHFIVAI